MILPNFILHSRKNKTWNESGIDSFNECHDREHFKTFPHPVIYQYNSRGFRDTEWPSTLEELQECVWCVGDSFTVGIGSPAEHMWSNILQSKINKRCINVSMDGASNKWIARKVIETLRTINPKLIIIHWSYPTRGEIDDNTLTDEDRRLPDVDLNDYNQLLIENFTLIKNVESYKKQCKIIHSFIPDSNFCNQDHISDVWNTVKSASWPQLPSNLSEFKQLDPNIAKELDEFFNVYKLLNIFYHLLNEISYVPEFIKLDLARDGLHYDIITATNFVDQLENLINC